MTKAPVNEAADQIILNENIKFKELQLQGIQVQTYCTLLSDFNGNGTIGLAVANDCRAADAYYLGDGKGNFKKINRSQGIIPTPKNTTSIDSGDFDNDLIPDLYMANIGLTKGNQSIECIWEKNESCWRGILPLGGKCPYLERVHTTKPYDSANKF